jgi:hypothetical protein
VKIFGLENKKKSSADLDTLTVFLLFPLVIYFMILITKKFSEVNKNTYLNVQCEAENTSYCEDPEGYPEKIILDLLTVSPGWINSGIFQRSSSQGRRYLRQPAATELT